MMRTTRDQARRDTLMHRWLSGAVDDSPAGPLYTSGEFAEAEMIVTIAAAANCSLITGSVRVRCCA